MHPNRPPELVLACKKQSRNRRPDSSKRDRSTCFEREARSTRGAVTRCQLPKQVAQQQYILPFQMKRAPVSAEGWLWFACTRWARAPASVRSRTRFARAPDRREPQPMSCSLHPVHRPAAAGCPHLPDSPAATASSSSSTTPSELNAALRSPRTFSRVKAFTRCST